MDSSGRLDSLTVRQLTDEHRGAMEKLRGQHNAELRRLQAVMKNALQSRRTAAAAAAAAAAKKTASAATNTRTAASGSEQPR